MDSNHRRRKPTDLQSAPFSHSGTYPKYNINGGPSGIRTPDHSVMSRVLWPTELKAHITLDIYYYNLLNVKSQAFLIKNYTKV